MREQHIDETMEPGELEETTEVENTFSSIEEFVTEYLVYLYPKNVTAHTTRNATSSPTNQWAETLTRERGEKEMIKSRTFITTYEELGEIIRTDRQALGWTQEELATKAGQDLSLVQTLENNQSTWDYIGTWEICNALGFDPQVMPAPEPLPKSESNV